MSESKPKGFAALMKMRKKEKAAEEEDMKPVIREVSLSSIEDRISALEKQLQDAEDESFVDVDEDSYSDENEEGATQDTKRREKKMAEERKQESQLLDRIKSAMAEDKGNIELGEGDAYCEACCLKLSGDMDISTHIESSSHLARLKVLFKNNLFSSSHSKNVCTTCCVSFGTPELLAHHREFRGHANNGTLKKRLCFCRLCKKQFTSGNQLSEHLKGKAHKERLERMITKQRGYRQSRGQYS